MRITPFEAWYAGKPTCSRVDIEAFRHIATFERPVVLAKSLVSAQPCLVIDSIVAIRKGLGEYLGRRKNDRLNHQNRENEKKRKPSDRVRQHVEKGKTEDTDFPIPALVRHGASPLSSSTGVRSRGGSGRCGRTLRCPYAPRRTFVPHVLLTDKSFQK